MVTRRRIVLAPGFAASLSLRTVGLFASVWGANIFAHDANAQSYPNHPIRCIVPYIAGSSPDVVARIIGPRLSERLAQTVVIDNRGGANSIIGTEIVARSLPDGYTILAGLPGPGGHTGRDHPAASSRNCHGICFAGSPSADAGIGL